MSTQVISFNCLLKNKAGHVISSTFNRDVLTSPQGQNLGLHGLAKGLQNLKKGERRSISLAAEEAYGLYEPSKVILYPRSKLPRHARVGEMITITGKSGAVRSYKIIQFHNDMASLDGNHPLAGQDLVFEIEALAVREATREEIAESISDVTTQVLH
ncbi:MAG: peptidylprolyl isomerase [Bdellovibrio sp. CG10_big_fil_rev_8_21_14_0_10_47_8]|nr:MAG: peptidylprolyl isomerase [Bdellovibrio sp. CG10_big_fil_rev_8_21_14_0_10_47_8]